jgi:hypothetical protein
MANAAFGTLFERAMERAPAVIDFKTSIPVAAVPPSGSPWSSQVIDVRFSKPLEPASFGMSDVAIIAPDGKRAEVLAVRHSPGSASPNLFDQKMAAGVVVTRPESPPTTQFFTDYQIVFRPTGYGDYLVTIGADVRDMRGMPLDQDGDGIGAYRSGSDQRDAYVNVVTVHAPGKGPAPRPAPEPARPAVEVDDDGATIGSITQYSKTADPSWFATAPSGQMNQAAVAEANPSTLRPGEIAFSVATINTQLRPDSLWESASIATPIVKALGKDDYDERVYNTGHDNQQRADLLAKEFFDFDIVAMQEVFDYDQVRQFYREATETELYQLRGSDTDVFGWSAGLSLFVRRDPDRWQ